MNILRPPHPSRFFKRFSMAFILLGSLSFPLSLLCIKLGLLPWELLSKVGTLLASKTLPYLLKRVGCSSTLAFVIVFALKTTIPGLDAESIKMMAPSGGSGSSSSNPLGFLDLNQQPEVEVPAEEASSSSLLEWQKALDLPDNAPAPESLRSHVKRELCGLFNIGKKSSVPEDFLKRVMEPLQLDSPDNKVGFFRKLAERVDELQREHLNRGNPKPFPFRTKREQERLYSVMWEQWVVFSWFS